jgi:hypothetical protein
VAFPRRYSGLHASVIAGVLCVALSGVGRASTVDVSGDALRHVNNAIATPVAARQPADPCAARGWSLAHPLRFCGRVRFVPADHAERQLWWGERFAEIADACFSAAGQHALFASRQVVVTGIAPASLARPATAFAIRGRGWTIAGLQGVAAPSQAEADSLLRPFAGGGIGGYLLGFAIVDVGQNALMNVPAHIGVRGLDEASRRSILGESIGEHIEGAQSWIPVLHDANGVTAITESCTQLAAQSWTYEPWTGHIVIAPPPKTCASIWPVP